MLPPLEPRRQHSDATTDMDRQQMGQAAEDAAVTLLRSQALRYCSATFVFAWANWTSSPRDGDTLAIVEVRKRSSAKFGGAAASVDFRKQIKLRRAANVLLQHRKDLTDCAFASMSSPSRRRASNGSNTPLLDHFTVAVADYPRHCCCYHYPALFSGSRRLGGSAEVRL